MVIPGGLRRLVTILDRKDFLQVSGIPLIWVEESIGKSESVDIVAIAPYSLVVQMVENKGIEGQQKSIPDRLKTLATRLPAEPVQIGDFSDCSRFPDPLLDPNLGYPGNLEDSYPSGMVTTRRKSPYNCHH